MTETVTVNFDQMIVCTIVETSNLYDATFASVFVTETGTKGVNFSNDFIANPSTGCPEI